MSTSKDTILERARALPRSVEPYRDLWDDIEANLDRNNEPTIWRPRLAAAAAVMFAVTSALSFWLGGVVNTPEPMQVAAVDPEVFNRFGQSFSGEGKIWLEGESWAAVSSVPVEKDQHVRVRAIDGLTLLVDPVDD